MSKDVSVGISYGGIFYPNLGCSALTYSSLQLLEEVSQRLGFKFHYMLRANYDVNNLFIPHELEGLSIQFLDKNTAARTLIKNLLRRNFADPLQFKELRKCSFFVDVVGGDSFSDIYGMDRICRLNSDVNKLSFLGKKVILLPQTIGPYKTRAAREMAANIMEKVSYVYARDKISYEEACRYVSPDKVELAVDMALFMDYTPRPRNHRKKVIGINPSGLLWHGGYSRDNQFGLVEEYKDVVRQCIELILQKEVFEVELVGHVLTGNYSFNIEDDYHACRELQKEYPQCRLAPFFYTPVEAKSYISGFDALLGSRMHCCIAAYSSGRPVFPLAYSRKFKGMFKETLQYPYGAELKDEGSETILQKLDDFLDRIDSVQEEISCRSVLLREYRASFMDSLSRQISLCLL